MSNNIDINQCSGDGSPVIITGECVESICSTPENLGTGVEINSENVLSTLACNKTLLFELVRIMIEMLIQNRA